MNIRSKGRTIEAKTARIKFTGNKVKLDYLSCIEGKDGPACLEGSVANVVKNLQDTIYFILENRPCLGK